MIRLFRHYIPMSLIFLGVVEFIVLWSAIYIGVAIRFLDSSDTVVDAVGALPPKALVFSLSIFILMIAFGLYQRNHREGFVGMAVRVFASFLVGLFLMTTMFYAVPELFLGRGAFGIAFGVAFFGVLLSRVIFLGVVDQETMKKRVLVLGTAKQASTLPSELRRKSDRRGFQIVGYLQLPGEVAQVESKQVLEYDGPLLAIVQRFRIDEIVVAVDDRRKGFPVHEVLDCKMSGIEVVDILSFYEKQTGKINLDFLQPSWMIFSDGFRQGTVRQYIKRGLDLFASFALLMITWPIMLIAAIAILIESKGRGGVFYKQIRVGEDWKLFPILKFRSMRPDAESDGQPKWAKTGDSRITKVGGFIRKLRIDELPQIFNILKGDMSFVGPRPERPEFVEDLCEQIPYYAERHRVKPGLTGWAQICYPYGSSERDAIEKLQYDLYYVKNYSLFLDFTVLIQTAEVILWSKGAR